MNATRKVKLKDITPNLTCQLCLGYFVDATTIIECLHSFCKSCIVKHLEKSEYCPVCDVQLHSTKPLSSIRSDQMLQEIVYKLVPGLFRKEMSHRREFYEKHPESPATSQMDSGQVFNELYITSDDIIHLSLEYFTDDPTLKSKTTRYLKCPAAVSIAILKKLVQGKFDLKSDVEIDVIYGERILPDNGIQPRILPDEFLLMDIAYKYSWTNNGSKPLQLSYRVKGLSPPLPQQFKSNKYLTPASARISSQIKRRRSRGSVDSEVTRSEILKSSNRNLSIESGPKTQISSITPKLTPNGKVRGRRKRSLTEDGGKTPAENKRKKLGKNSPMKDSKEMESQSDPMISKSSLEPPKSYEKEVQLRISENGVISAKSIFSGEEKIILGSLLKSPPKSNASSTATGQTEARNDMASNNNNNEKSTNVTNPGLVHPLLISNSVGTSSRSNYVKLNIPIITTSTATGISPPICNGPNKMVPNGNVNGSPSAKIPASSSSPQKLTPSKRKLLEKVTTGICPNGTTSANPNEFEDKKANVKKALIDLEKKLYTSISKGSLSQLPGMLGISGSNNREPVDESPSNHIGSNGGHNIPKSQPHLNGTHLQNPFPFPLNFGSSGMTVNLIPSTTNCPSAMGGIASPISNPSPQKKPGHSMTQINGDSKFASPRHILPSPSKEVKPTGPSSASPKKPPKFFKSRHSSSAIPGTTPTSSDSESPIKKDSSSSSSSSTKTGSTNGNASHSFSFGSITTPTVSKPSSIGANTITTPSGMGSSHSQLQASRLQSQVSNAFNPMNLHLNQLQMNLAAAAATSSPNNMPMALVPFVTSNYCSMPFLNGRQPFGMNMSYSSHMPSYPFAYSGMGGPTFTPSQPFAPATTLNGSVNGSHHPHIPIFPKVSNSTDEGKNNGHQSLDLSLKQSNGKGRNGHNSGLPQNEPLSLTKSISPKMSLPSVQKSSDKTTKKIDLSAAKSNGPMSLVPKATPALGLVSKESDSKTESTASPLVAKELREIKPKSDEISIEIQSQSTLSNDSAGKIDKSDNNNSKPTTANNTTRPDDKVTIKLQNGHPEYSNAAVVDVGNKSSSPDKSNAEVPIPLASKTDPSNRDGHGINGNSKDAESHQNGDKSKRIIVLDMPIIEGLSKNQTPSCNNNNSPPELSHTSSTTGA